MTVTAATMVNARRWAARHMRDIRVTVTTRSTSVDVNPATGDAIHVDDETFADVRAALVERTSEDDDRTGNVFGLRDQDFLIALDTVTAGQRVEITFSRHDPTLVGLTGTIRNVNREPTAPARRCTVRLDDNA